MLSLFQQKWLAMPYLSNHHRAIAVLADYAERRGRRFEIYWLSS